MELMIRKAKHGDKQAADFVVRSMWRRLEKMAGYYAAVCREDAGDLLQEAWLGVLEGVRDVDLSIGTPEQYLLKRAKWKMLTYVKYSRRRTHEPYEEVERQDPAPSVESEATFAAIAQELDERLTPIQREVLKALLAGHTWREAGVRIGCSSANVAYHVKKIKKEYMRLASECGALEQVA